MSKEKTISSIQPQVRRLAREWHLRFLVSLAALLVVMLISLIILILRNDIVSKKIDMMVNEFYDWCGTKGIVLEDIVISGRERTLKEDISKALNLSRGANMLKIDVYDIKQRLEELPWIAKASVKRCFYPNVLNIQITEKQVVAIWQVNEKFYPLDSNGNIIDADFKITEPILLIVGSKAPENFKQLISKLQEIDEEYLKRIKVANFISGRRWNLIMDDIRNGVTVKLPEDDVVGVWKKLIKLDKSKGIFKRKLTIIDLRLKNKVVVKLRKGASEEVPLLTDSKEHKL